eukprot:Gb_29894 [translate_table: standard]
MECIKRGMSKIPQFLFKFLPHLNGDIYVSLDSEPYPNSSPHHSYAHCNCFSGRENLSIPKGYFCVRVGEERKRFLVPTLYLKHRLIRLLLERSAEEYGIDQSGVITIPCDVETFQYVLGLVHTDPTATEKNCKGTCQAFLFGHCVPSNL